MTSINPRIVSHPPSPPRGGKRCSECKRECVWVMTRNHSWEGLRGHWRHNPGPVLRRPKRPRRRLVKRGCVSCGIPGSPANPVMSFGLRHARALREPDGSWRSIATSAGSVALCRECWETHAKPQMNPKKGRSARQELRRAV